MRPEDRDAGVRLSDVEAKAQRRRSVAIGITLVALVVLFYVMTLIKMGGGAG